MDCIPGKPLDKWALKPMQPDLVYRDSLGIVVPYSNLATSKLGVVFGGFAACFWLVWVTVVFPKEC